MIRVRGAGPFYWGVERYSVHPDKRVVASSFLIETLPPWRQSTHGMRFRLGKKELHMGLAKKGTDPERVIKTEHSDPEVAEVLKAIYDTQMEDRYRVSGDYRDPWAGDGE